VAECAQLLGVALQLGWHTCASNKFEIASNGYFEYHGRIGTGAANRMLLEAQLACVLIDGFVMRGTNAGALNLALGYRSFL
jgi:hypothetical protein